MCGICTTKRLSCQGVFIPILRRSCSSANTAGCHRPGGASGAKRAALAAPGRSLYPIGLYMLGESVRRAGPSGPGGVLRSQASWACATAMLAAGLLYLNALHNPFVYDDYQVVVQNRSLLGPFDLAGLVAHNVSRPLVNASYALDLRLWGPTPFGFHAVNVLLHVLDVG